MARATDSVNRDGSNGSGRHAAGVMGTIAGLRRGLRDELDELLILFRRLVDDVTRLGDQKLALLRADLASDMRSLVRDLWFLAGAIGLFMTATIMANMALAYLVAAMVPYDTPVNYALGMVVVAVVNAAAGGAMYIVWRRRSEERARRQRASTMDLSRDREWLRGELGG